MHLSQNTSLKLPLVKAMPKNFVWLAVQSRKAIFVWDSLHTRSLGFCYLKYQRTSCISYNFVGVNLMYFHQPQRKYHTWPADRQLQVSKSYDTGTNIGCRIVSRLGSLMKRVTHCCHRLGGDRWRCRRERSNVEAAAWHHQSRGHDRRNERTK